MVDGVRQQEQNGSPMNGALLIAFLIGVFGFVVAHRLTTSMRRTGDMVGTVPVGAQQRTLALLLACLVPAAAGTVFLVYMLVTGAIWPPVGLPADAPVAWFRDESDLAVLATLVALGPVAALGGPLLGVAVARWAPFRGSALVGVVTLVFVVALPSDAPAPWTVLPPWPILYGEHANDQGQLTDSLLIPGVVQGWILVYVLCLCGLAAVAALLRDPTAGHCSGRRCPHGRRGRVLPARRHMTWVGRTPWQRFRARPRPWCSWSSRPRSRGTASRPS